MADQSQTTAEVPYPFVRSTYTAFDADGPHDVPTWRPGTRPVEVQPDGVDFVADEMGAMLLTIIGTFRPAGYPERTFFVRQWRTPDGKVFGAKKLRITTSREFRALLKGFRHQFRMAQQEAVNDDR